MYYYYSTYLHDGCHGVCVCVCVCVCFVRVYPMNIGSPHLLTPRTSLVNKGESGIRKGDVMPPYPLVSLGSPRGDNVRVHTHMGVRVYVSRMGVCHGACVCVCVCVCVLWCACVCMFLKNEKGR